MLYYLIGGHAIDFVLQGKVDKEWEKELAGQPFIVQNSTFQALSTAVARFSEPFKEQLLIVPSSSKKGAPEGRDYDQEALDRLSDLAEKFAGMPVFIGSDASVAAAQIGDDASKGDLESLSNRQYSWQATVSPYSNEPKGVGDLIFWRFGGPLTWIDSPTADSLSPL